MTPHNAAPYVGHSAFAHKGGVHVEEALSEAATWTMVMSERGIVDAVSHTRTIQRRAKAGPCPSIATRPRTCSSGCSHAVTRLAPRRQPVDDSVPAGR